MSWSRWMVLLSVLVLYSEQAMNAQTEEAKWARIESLSKNGPSTVDLGDQATLVVPAGFKFLPPDAARLFDELAHNISPEGLVGTVVYPDPDPNRLWFLRFTYDESGRVPDDERDQLDAKAILATIKSGQESANITLRNKGWSKLQIDGWQNTPHYNQELKRLEWCILLHNDDGNRSANFNTRLLGRTGVMNVVAIGSPEVVQQITPQIHQVLSGFSFKSGKQWAEWKPGDKTAAYGLTALVTGGTTVALTKSGLLVTVGKFIAVLFGLFAATAVGFSRRWATIYQTHKSKVPNLNLGMHFWNIEQLKSEMAASPLSEREVLPYLVMSVFISSVAAEIPHTIGNLWDWLGLLRSALLATVGTIYIYRQNGGAAGRHFLQRYLAIGWVVAIRWFAVLILCAVPYYVVLWSLGADGNSTRWYDFVLVTTVEAGFYLWMGYHVKDLAQRAIPA